MHMLSSGRFQKFKIEGNWAPMSYHPYKSEKRPSACHDHDTKSFETVEAPSAGNFAVVPLTSGDTHAPS